MFRLAAVIVTALALAACTNPDDLEEKPVYLGNFNLGHNVVVAPNLTKGPASRDASKGEWIGVMKTAIDERFSRYDGDKLYHIGISLEGYVLAIPGVPVVASPKSALILNVTAWDDASQTKLNEKPELITVVESVSGRTVLGSGLTQSKERQMRNLTRNAAKLVENWLVSQNNEHGWFEADGRPAKEKNDILGNRVMDTEASDGTADVTDDPAGEAGAAPGASSDAAAAAAAAAVVLEEPEVAPLDEDG
ncbi:hypothetical protein AAFO92_19745 [Roseovarius sp. CAU 1744]|uniref:hypothetical protein n=1 Tax=Roseovarius sp. CAU 1744 TaxID=3140368 RepID=UPI00325AAE0C